jgi:processive 1,2-diacylglycerol beta-glucosyltransferase
MKRDLLVNNSYLENHNKTIKQSSDKQVNTIVLFSNAGEHALSILRVKGPAIAAGLQVISGVENGEVHLERVNDGDIVVIQRDFSGDLNAFEKIIALAHSQMKPVVMDMDDLLFELPENHPDRISNYYSDALLSMLQAIMEVDLITVATPALRNYLLDYNKNIKVFPNYLNDNLWSLKEPAKNELNSKTITIGYMGGHTHKPDLLVVYPVLESLLRKYPQKIKFHFWGIEPPIGLGEFSQVDWCPPPSYTYVDFASYFQTQTADIMIAPLADSLFNSCKSPIKYLEYSALGVPGVYSKISPYEIIVKDGVDGLLASTSLEWEEALSKLIEDQDLRRRIALNAQEKIHKHWLLSKNSYKLRRLYENTVVNYPTHKQHLSSFHMLVRSLAQQTYDNNRHKNQQIIDHVNRITTLENEIIKIDNQNIQLNQQLDQSNIHISQLNEQINQLNEQINQLITQREDLLNRIKESEEEIVSYVLSTSWQITRPLRKISYVLHRGK